MTDYDFQLVEALVLWMAAVYTLLIIFSLIAIGQAVRNIKIEERKKWQRTETEHRLIRQRL